MHHGALWSYRNKDLEGFNICEDVFEWLDAVYAKWTSIPLVRLYELMHKHYLKSLPTDLIVPPAFDSFRPSLSPLPLNLVANFAQTDEPKLDSDAVPVASTSTPRPITVTSIPNPECVKSETPSAHQHSVGCAASNTDLSPTAACCDANALLAVAQPHISPLPPKSTHTMSTQSNVLALASTDASLLSSMSTLSSDVSATSKRHCHCRGQKKHRSEQHQPSIPTSAIPHPPSAAVHSLLPSSSHLFNHWQEPAALSFLPTAHCPTLQSTNQDSLRFN
ncbi:uncharacterized protein EI90DRAFT_3123805 [Cantharellus anzutake]|uniref:uncharacterized protein n=1 Tax=Cantharellus anzutake TaxID=1750568 RepID=UPI001908DCCF|nr:uncharacterized protein EI90DRAFT_3123805 [Cantharellus anzutake]KAF8331062.1 hypothetical protein EI90DRAFT_3123805 [Cantharellus anzutake]